MTNTDLLEPRRSLVTWIDILGYRAMLTAGDYAAAHGASRALSRFNANDPGGLEGDWETYRDTFAVSDAVIRVVDAQAPFAEGCLFYELSNLAINQLNTVLDGVVVSGGMCVGEVCLGSNAHRTPMGEAVGRAYELDESRWEPAICLDSALVNAFFSDSTYHAHAPKEEADYTMPWLLHHENRYFINYLMAATQDEGELHDALETHRNLIIENYANETLPMRAREKYRFLRDYHNAFINWLLSEEGSSAIAIGYAFATPDINITELLSSLRIETDTHDHAIRFWNKETTGFVTYAQDGSFTEPVAAQSLNT